LKYINLKWFHAPFISHRGREAKFKTSKQAHPQADIIRHMLVRQLQNMYSRWSFKYIFQSYFPQFYEKVHMQTQYTKTALRAAFLPCIL
jgi:hypothetical protein